MSEICCGPEAVAQCFWDCRSPKQRNSKSQAANTALSWSEMQEPFPEGWKVFLLKHLNCQSCHWCLLLWGAEEEAKGFSPQGLCKHHVKKGFAWKHYFTVITAKQWHRLPKETVKPSSLEILKTQLDMVLGSLTLLERCGGLDNFTRSLPTSTILWNSLNILFPMTRWRWQPWRGQPWRGQFSNHDALFWGCIFKFDPGI